MTSDAAEFLVRTKLIAPQPRRQWLRRPRLDALLTGIADAPLTLVVGGTGYGKSTTLASYFATVPAPVAWYSLDREDADPVRFLRHVVGALRLVRPGVAEGVLGLLRSGWSAQLGDRAVDLLADELLTELRGPVFLVLDDYQDVDTAPIGRIVQRLLAHAPPQLHLVIAARHPPHALDVRAWRARALLHTIDQRDLAFTPDEVAALFGAAGHELPAVSAAQLVARTEGWAMALQLLRQGATAVAPAAVDAASLATLFDYLAAEVLDVQPADVQHFLLGTSILRVLEPALCDQLLERGDSAATLEQLHRHEVFLLRLGPASYRYHQLFGDFLAAEAQKQGLPLLELHGRAARYLLAAGDAEEALHHLCAAGDYGAVAGTLERISGAWIRGGQAVALQGWLQRLPPAQLHGSPELLLAAGDAARLTSHFDPALVWYGKAQRRWAELGDRVGQSRALQGQAQVYLDTVRPAPAHQLLKQALKLLGRRYRRESAALLQLLAENTTNLGQAGLAAKLHAAAERMDPRQPTPAITAARVELRTGRIQESRRRLEAHREELLLDERHPPEAHREPLLLLALLACWMGDAKVAGAYAAAGLRRGQAISSPIVEAVGQIRLGHYLQLAHDADGAAGAYGRALALAAEFGVARTKAEPLMGLTLLAGSRGDLPQAEQHAREALAIVERTGDQWMAALLWLALASARVVRRQPTALAALDAAERSFRVGGDTYGLAAVRLWRAIALLQHGRVSEATPEVGALLALVQQHHYAYLLTQATLFTPRDRQMLAPALLLAWRAPETGDDARALVAQLFPALVAQAAAGTMYHPGVTLRVDTLGQFRVWRGVEEVTTWGRDKARLLLQLLVTERGGWLQREQIVDRLWPDASLATADNQFKVTLNALTTALEPGRPPHSASFYIKRNGSAYRFAPLPDAVVLDVVEIERGLAAAESAATPPERIALYQRALALYGGPYLPESLYEDWVAPAREQLQRRYVAGAFTLAALLFGQGSVDEAIGWCERVLRYDPCWEAAYRLLMRAYAEQGNRPLALRTYQRCVAQLDLELGVAPLGETTALYDQLRGAA